MSSTTSTEASSFISAFTFTVHKNTSSTIYYWLLHKIIPARFAWYIVGICTWINNLICVIKYEITWFVHIN